MAERHGAATIDKICAAAYRIPTDRPEADGTFAWTSTTLVIVYVHAANKLGLGFTYAHASAVAVIEELLAPAIVNRDFFDIGGCWIDMQRARYAMSAVRALRVARSRPLTSRFGI